MEAARTSYTPAPESTVTVAPFQAWRSSQPIVAREPIQATIKHFILPDPDSGVLSNLR